MKVKEISVSVKYGKTIDYETIQVSQNITIELDEKDNPEEKRRETRDKLLKECKEFVQNSRKNN